MKLASIFGMTLVCVLVADLSNAENLKVDGRLYENIRWGSATPVDVTVFHKEGVAKIPLASLTPDIQAKYGYDPEKAAAYLDEQEKKKTEERSAKYYGLDDEEAPVYDDSPQRDFTSEIDGDRFYLVREVNGAIYGPFDCVTGAVVAIEKDIYDVMKVNGLLFTLRSKVTGNPAGPFWMKDNAAVNLGDFALVVMRPTTVQPLLNKRDAERAKIMATQRDMSHEYQPPAVTNNGLEGKKVDKGLTKGLTFDDKKGLKKGK